MDPLIQEIIDFKPLQVYVQSSESNLVESTKRYYLNLGTKLGMDTTSDVEGKIEGVKFPPVSIAWLDGDKPLVGFSFCFGSKKEILSSIFSLLALQAELSVIVSSSKSRNYSLEELRKILEEPVFINLTTKFLLIDISTEKFIIV